MLIVDMRHVYLPDVAECHATIDIPDLDKSVHCGFGCNVEDSWFASYIEPVKTVIEESDVKNYIILYSYGEELVHIKRNKYYYDGIKNDNGEWDFFIYEYGLYIFHKDEKKRYRKRKEHLIRKDEEAKNSKDKKRAIYGYEELFRLFEKSINTSSYDVKKFMEEIKNHKYDSVKLEFQDILRENFRNIGDWQDPMFYRKVRKDGALHKMVKRSEEIILQKELKEEKKFKKKLEKEKEKMKKKKDKEPMSIDGNMVRFFGKNFNKESKNFMSERKELVDLAIDTLKNKCKKGKLILIQDIWKDVCSKTTKMSLNDFNKVLLALWRHKRLIDFHINIYGKLVYLTLQK